MLKKRSEHVDLSLPLQAFRAYVSSQFNHFFPDGENVRFDDYAKIFEKAIHRTEFCFSHVTLSSYYKSQGPSLNHLHSDQYAVFLWFLSNTVWVETENQILANKLFYLNKTLHGFSCMYDTKLPDIFLLLHTVGTVLGKANYSDFLVVAQGTTVGAHNGVYPVLGKGVSLLPYSSIVGRCTIGDRVSVGIGASVYQQDVRSDTVVFRNEDGSIRYKQKDNCWAQKLFNVKI
ncbi:hypothetical protein [Paenibacillus tianmuensis]|uniref:hypothetical protein n=1 Tax=Paenibacillus tianmuensis TaxID=624147 RepID=UPI001C25BCE3|nr:hypothetical protein [Paenibacillus tianmuensis]